MYIYNNCDKIIILNKLIIFKKYFLYYISGRLNEDEFKIFRLHHGFYRQRLSYMFRLLIPYGVLSLKQIYLISYLLNKYDNNYLHFTTRTNIQLNWVKLLNIYFVFYYLNFVNLHFTQTSGNCIRNITINQDHKFLNYFNNKPWAELIRQWFFLNSEFLFLPRKFKISILTSRIDDNYLKIHDLGINLKKNSNNNIILDILIGGGLGRTPILGSFVIKNLHWKNVFNYCDKILRIYNINGIRKNIYKARIKIFLKFININKFLNFIKNELYYSNNIFFILNEKEINKIFFKFKYNFKFYKKKIYNFIKFEFNIFFVNWFNCNCNFSYKKDKLNLTLLIKFLNSPSGDINFFQVKIIFYLFYNFKYFIFNINNKQNIIFNLKDKFIYFLYIKLKKYFFININNNSLLDIITCPGKDFCILANAESISLFNSIQYKFLDFNSNERFNNISLNISGCINSCAYHHVSNIGILGVNKNFENWYQILIGGQNNYNNLKFSKILGPSFSNKKIIYILINLLKFFLKKKFLNENFVDFYNRINFKFFKDNIIN